MVNQPTIEHEFGQQTRLARRLLLYSRIRAHPVWKSTMSRNLEKKRAYQAAYYAAHRDEVLARTAAYHAAHPEKYRTYQAAYRAAHREKIRAYYIAHRDRKRAYNAAYRAAHRDECRASERRWAAENRDRKRMTQRVWRAEHREHRRAYQARWQATHREHIAAYTSQYVTENMARKLDWNARRRAKKRGVTVEKVSRMIVYERDAGRCHICKKKVPHKRFHLDHLIPLANGGEHSYRNIAVACPSCNVRKHTGRLPSQLRVFG